jgi:hypothetical protein
MESAIHAIADVVRLTPGVVFTPYTPPDQFTEFQLPAILIYPLRGQDELGTAHGGNGLPVVQRRHTLQMDLHVQYQDTALETASMLALSVNEPLSKRIWRGFLNDRFNGTVMLLGAEDTPPLRWEFVSMNWGGTATIGFRYEVDMTIMEDIP